MKNELKPCPFCGGQAFNRSEDNDPDFDVDTPYCPVCGCRMDGGDDECVELREQTLE